MLSGVDQAPKVHTPLMMEWHIKHIFSKRTCLTNSLPVLCNAGFPQMFCLLVLTQITSDWNRSYFPRLGKAPTEYSRHYISICTGCVAACPPSEQICCDHYHYIKACSLTGHNDVWAVRINQAKHLQRPMQSGNRQTASGLSLHSINIFACIVMRPVHGQRRHWKCR